MPICWSLVRWPKKIDSFFKAVRNGFWEHFPPYVHGKRHHFHLSWSKKRASTCSLVWSSRIWCRVKYCSIYTTRTTGLEPSNLYMSSLGGRGWECWWFPWKWIWWIDSPWMCSSILCASWWYLIMVLVTRSRNFEMLSSCSLSKSNLVSRHLIFSLAMTWALVSTIHISQSLEVTLKKFGSAQKMRLISEWYHCDQLVVLNLMG